MMFIQGNPAPDSLEILLGLGSWLIPPGITTNPGILPRSLVLKGGNLVNPIISQLPAQPDSLPDPGTKPV